MPKCLFCCLSQYICLHIHHNQNFHQYISELETIGKSVKNAFDNIKTKMHNSVLDLMHYVSDHGSYLLLNSFYVKYCK